MSLYKLNFKIADNIIERYSQLLKDLPNRHHYDKYGYSDLKGYDVNDISNSLALMTAYRVSNTNIIDEYYELNKLDKSSPDFLINSIGIQSDFKESEVWKNSLMKETPESFLKFCIYIKKNESHRYWCLVFERLKIECDTSEEYDRIYSEVKNEKQRALQEIKEQNKKAIEIIKEEKEEIYEEKGDTHAKQSFFYSYKTDLLNFLVVSIFVLCLFNIIVRNIFFIFLLCFNVFMIISSWREKLFTTPIMKYNLIKDIVMSTVLLIGLLSYTIGFYATIFCLGLQIFDFIKHFITTHFREQSSTKPSSS